eukprot:jgi/Mesvir1/3785/Mv26121-RA.3
MIPAADLPGTPGSSGSSSSSKSAASKRAFFAHEIAEQSPRQSRRYLETNQGAVNLEAYVEGAGADGDDVRQPARLPTSPPNQLDDRTKTTEDQMDAAERHRSSHGKAFTPGARSVRMSMESAIPNPFLTNDVELKVHETPRRRSTAERLRRVLANQSLPVSAVVVALFAFVAAANLALFFTLRRFERESASTSFQKFGDNVVTTLQAASARGLELAVRDAMSSSILTMSHEIVEGKNSAANLLQSAARLARPSVGYSGLRLDTVNRTESPDLEHLREVMWSLQHVAHGLSLVPNLFVFSSRTGDFVELWRDPVARLLYWSVTTAVVGDTARVTTFSMDEATGKVDYGVEYGHSLVVGGGVTAWGGVGQLGQGDIIWTPPNSVQTWRTDMDGPVHSADRMTYALTPLLVNGTVLGMLGSAIRMVDIGLMLHTTLPDKGMVMFIFDHLGSSAGQMIAASHGALDLPNVTALGWDHPEIVFVGEQLLAEFGSWESVPDNFTRFMEMLTPTGEHYRTLFVQTAVLPLAWGIEWMSVMFLDEDPYLASSVAATEAAIVELRRATRELENEFSSDNWWGYSSLVLQVVLLGWLWYLLQVFLVRPMAMLSRQMKAMEDLTVPEKRRSSSNFSRFTEVRRMEDTFESMAVVLSAFGKFVPKVVVKRIVAREDHAMQLYVFPVVVTIMFTDIANFTTISEKIPLQLLMRVLEDYLSEMSSLIEASGGVIGDFIGDGIMAFWNSPTPVPNHELMAVETMERQMERLVSLNERWQVSSVPEVWPRYGIHTGKVYSGNIGSQEKMKFGIVGDPVNLAARLESLCKHFGAKNLLSREVYACIQDEFLGFLHGKVAVKGKSLPVMVYEILCRCVVVNIRNGVFCTCHLPRHGLRGPVPVRGRKHKGWCVLYL